MTLRTRAGAGNALRATSLITTSGPTPSASRFATVSYDFTDRGTFVVGVSHDTHAFAAPAIATGGIRKVPSAAPARARFSFWPTQLANTFALAVTVAHYPTGATKWHPIEHRLFSEVSRNWAAVRWTLARRSSTTPEQPTRKPAFTLPPTWTVALILAASSPPQTKSPHSVCSGTNRCLTGTIPSGHNCEVVPAWLLSGRRFFSWLPGQWQS